MKDHFRLHQVEGYICSLFLAEYDDKILILDSGCASDVPRLVNFISNELHRPMSDVKLAVATHGHPDHSGGACELHRRYAIPIAAPRGLFERYKGFSGLFCKVVDCLLIWTVARKMKKRFENVWFDNHFTPNYIYTDEGRLPLFHDWMMIPASGHSPNDFILYHADKRLLYASDLMIRPRNKVTLSAAVLCPNAMASSLEKIVNLEVKTLLLAHGGPVPVDDMSAIVQSLTAELARKANPSGIGLKMLKFHGRMGGESSSCN